MNTNQNRRNYHRISSQVPITYAGWNSVVYADASMHNYSKGGINFESASALLPGSDIQVRVENFRSEVLERPFSADRFRAEVIWCKEIIKEDATSYSIGAQYVERFWEKAYDEGLVHLDPQLWETTYLDVIQPTFEAFTDNPAFTYMGVSVTFSELDRYANRFANMLIESGLKKGDVVGINLPNIPEYIIAWLGTLKAGCIVSGVSPLLSTDELAFQLGNSRSRALVTLDAIFAGRLVHIEKDLPELELVVAASVGGFLPPIKRVLGKLLGKIPKGRLRLLDGKTVFRFEVITRGERFSASRPEVVLSPNDIAYLQYTGGTTGRPKGAMLSHRNVVSNTLVFEHWIGWKKEKRYCLSCFPFFHIAGLFFNYFCIYLGASQILIPNPRDTARICSELDKYKPESISNVPSLYQLLMHEPKFKSLDHSKLTICFSGASPFPEESQRAFENIIGKGKLVEVYGMTETAPLVTSNPLKKEKRLGSIGLPLLNTDIKLKDPASGREVPIGQPGEICVKGPQVMEGYYNNAEATEKSFDADGYLLTGDVAVFDEDGYLTIVDRVKDMLLVGGFNVYSQKVEEVLARHPAVNMVAIIGIPNPDRPGSEIVKALVTIQPGYSIKGDDPALKDDIIRYARSKLAPYEVPKIIEFGEELPLTNVGKIDKKKLRLTAV